MCLDSGYLLQGGIENGSYDRTGLKSQLCHTVFDILSKILKFSKPLFFHL